MPQHIFFTGMPGSGKTTLGKKISALLNLSFVDLDEYIETKERKKIFEIFDSEGEKSFRAKEKFYLNELVQSKPARVVSLGGGAICFDENLSLVKNTGLLIYLDMPPAALAERLKQSKTKRPLFKNIPEEKLLKTVSETLEQRKKYYEQAHIKINALNLTVQQLSQTILDFTQKNNS